jgi:hypothetical protein
MGSPHHGHGVDGGGRSDDEEGDAGSWRLRMDSGFSVPDRFHRQPPFYARIFGGSHGAPHARPPAPLDLLFCRFRQFLLFASCPPSFSPRCFYLFHIYKTSLLV